MRLDQDLPLQIPMAEKDEAKKLGARPQYVEGTFICWYAPAGMDVMSFQKWWTPEFVEMMVDQGVIDAPVAEKAPAQGESLISILSRVKVAVSTAFKEPVWIRAEIVNITGSKHMYLELSDYDQSGRENAKARGMIWSKDKHIINQFKEVSGLDLKPGLKILFKGKVEFSEQFGLGIAITAIDPAFTLGDMEAKLAGIRKQLKEKGVYGKNKEFPQPNDFMNVAVISPREAAGLADFKSQANILEEHGLCSFTYYDAVFSGPDCVRSIINAMRQAHRQVGTIDACVIIRGGGDKAGLYALNEFDIANAVCLFRAPVIVGIGHEPDNTILDEVACVRCPTPSLAITHITSKITKNAQQAKQNMLSTSRIASEIVARARQRTEGAFSDVKDKARSTIEKARSNCEVSRNSALSAATNYLERSRMRLKGMMEQVYANNPLNVLNKGYAVVREVDGPVITSAQHLEGKTIEIQLKDGKVAAVTGQPVNFKQEEHA